MVASFLLASWFGCVLAATPWSDRFGRRVWVIAGAIMQVFGTIVAASAFSPGQLIAGRVLIGVGNGFVVSAGPVYVAETTGTVSQRGPLVGILMGFACTGTALSYWICFGFTYATGQIVWRLPVAMQIIFSVLTVVLILPNADSPRWYYLKGRAEEGKLVLQQIYADDMAKADKVAFEIEAELSQESHEKLRLSDFLVDKSANKAATRIRDGVVLIGKLSEAFRSMNLTDHQRGGIYDGHKYDFLLYDHHFPSLHWSACSHCLHLLRCSYDTSCHRLFRRRHLL